MLSMQIQFKLGFIWREGQRMRCHLVVFSGGKEKKQQNNNNNRNEEQSEVTDLAIQTLTSACPVFHQNKSEYKLKFKCVIMFD